MSSFVKNVMKLSLQYACITHCVFEYIADVVVCSGPSMEPTLYSNNILITEKLTTRFYGLNRGDIIIAISPLNPDQYICKRIVGIAGDKITTVAPVIDVQSTSNTTKLDDTQNAFDIKFTDEYVPKGHVWVEGDNHNNSADSRYYGPIPLGLIRSRAICRIWPIIDLKIL